MADISVRSLCDELGASDANPMLVILFVPTQDKEGKEIKNPDLWLDSAIKVLSNAFGGATVMAPAEGAWFNADTKQVIRERVHLVHSYGKPDLAKFKPIAEFLHRMGRETKQGEVGIVVDGIFHRIIKFRGVPAKGRKKS